MSSKPIEIAVAVAMLILGLVFLLVGSQASFYGRMGPGSGFMPVLVGAGLAALSLARIVQQIRAAGPGPAFIAPGQSARAAILMALACLSLLLVMPVFGFRLAIFAFVLIVPNILGRCRPLPLIAAAAVGSFGTDYVFSHLLQLRLPTASIEALRSLGF